jgi:selenide,water dikinase
LSAATDVTGFSLLGHAYEMAEASNVALHFDYTQIPFVSGAHKYAEMWAFPGGASDNRAHFGSYISFDASIEEAEQMLLFDPQTSGGLLLGVPKDKLSAFQVRAKELEQPIWVIGEVHAGSGIVVQR